MRELHDVAGFTLHLMQRFDEAIYCYHQALALQPKLAICAEMVNRAMEDSIHYGSAVEQGRAEPHVLSFSAAIAEPQKGQVDKYFVHCCPTI